MGDSMPKGKPESSLDSADSISVFNVAKIRELIELMQEHELNEIDLKQSDQRIRLRRGAADAPVVYTAPPASAPATPAPQAAVASAPAGVDNSNLILSPTIGTFYSRPKPDSPDFVKVGDMVTPDTIVCLVEAMKMFNEIEVEFKCKIVEIVKDDATPVEYGETLFLVERL